MTIRAVIIDRDGTLNVEKHYVHRIPDFEFLPGAVDALRRVTERGVEIHVVTNQAGIAKGLYGEDDFHRLNRHMLDDLGRQGVRIESVRYCPHHPQALVPEYRRDCECRKPRPGMLSDILAERAYGRDEVVMIGDRNSDVDAGRRLGLVSYLVLTGYGHGEASDTSADHVVADLAAALDHVLSGRQALESGDVQASARSPFRSHT